MKKNYYCKAITLQGKPLAIKTQLFEFNLANFWGLVLRFELGLVLRVEVFAWIGVKFCEVEFEKLSIIQNWRHQILTALQINDTKVLQTKTFYFKIL